MLFVYTTTLYRYDIHQRILLSGVARVVHCWVLVLPHLVVRAYVISQSVTKVTKIIPHIILIYEYVKIRDLFPVHAVTYRTNNDIHKRNGHRTLNGRSKRTIRHAAVTNKKKNYKYILHCSFSTQYESGNLWGGNWGEY